MKGSWFQCELSFHFPTSAMEIIFIIYFLLMYMQCLLDKVEHVHSMELEKYYYGFSFVQKRNKTLNPSSVSYVVTKFLGKHD